MLAYQRIEHPHKAEQIEVDCQADLKEHVGGSDVQMLLTLTPVRLCASEPRESGRCHVGGDSHRRRGGCS